MKKKIIGITADIKGKFYEIESFYFERILELNMVPVMLPMIENSRYIKKISKEIDGILISEVGTLTLSSMDKRKI